MSDTLDLGEQVEALAEQLFKTRLGRSKRSDEQKFASEGPYLVIEPEETPHINNYRKVTYFIFCRRKTPLRNFPHPAQAAKADG